MAVGVLSAIELKYGLLVWKPLSPVRRLKAVGGTSRLGSWLQLHLGGKLFVDKHRKDLETKYLEFVAIMTVFAWVSRSC